MLKNKKNGNKFYHEELHAKTYKKMKLNNSKNIVNLQAFLYLMYQINKKYLNDNHHEKLELNQNSFVIYVQKELKEKHKNSHYLL